MHMIFGSQCNNEVSCFKGYFDLGTINDFLFLGTMISKLFIFTKQIYYLLVLR